MEPSEDNINNAPVSKSAEWEDKTQSSDGSATFTSPGKPSDGAGCLTTSANPDTENQQQSVVVDDSEENSTDRNGDEELSPPTACEVGSGPTTRAAGAMPVVSIQIIPSSPIGDEAPVVSQPVNSEDSRASSMSPEAVAALSDTSSNTEVTGVRDGTQAEDTSPRPRDNLVQEDGLPLYSTETADQETNVSSASSSQSRTTRRRFEDPRQVTMLYMNQHNVDGVLKKLIDGLALDQPADPIQYMYEKIDDLRKTGYIPTYSTTVSTAAASAAGNGNSGSSQDG